MGGPDVHDDRVQHDHQLALAGAGGRVRGVHCELLA
jgi:hypothetical protein